MSNTTPFSQDYSHKSLNNFYFSTFTKTLENTKFINSTLERVNFAGMTLTNVDFTNAKLTNVDFTNATFRNTTLNNVNFINTIFENANLERVKCDIPRNQKFLIILSSLIIGAFSGFTSNILFNYCHNFFRGQYNPWLSGLFSFIYIVSTRIIIYKATLSNLNLKYIMNFWIYIGVILILFVGIGVPFAIENLKKVENKKEANINNAKQNGSSKDVFLVCLLVVVVDLILILISQNPKYKLSSDESTLLRVVIASFLGTIAGTMISRESITKKNQKFIWLWNAFVYSACINGTKFNNCKFKNADFSAANFKGCTFTLTNSDIRNTKWCNVKQIDSCIIIGSYLANSEIQELLINRNGIRKHFDNLEIPGLYLFDADLEGASFINSNLSHSILSEAKLELAKFEKTRLDYADLSNAKLTGITIASRSVPSTTVLNNIQCFYFHQPSNPDMAYPSDKNNLTSEQAINYLREKSPPIITFPDKNIDWEAFSQAIENSLEELGIRLKKGTGLIQAFEQDPEGNFIIKFYSIPNINEEDFLKKIKEKYELERKVKNIEYVTSLDNIVFNLANIQIIKFVTTTVNLNPVQKQTEYNLFNPLFNGGFSGEHGITIGGELNNYSPNINLSIPQALNEIITDITQQLNELKNKSYSQEQAQEKIVLELINNAKHNPSFSAMMSLWRLILEGNMLGGITINQEVMEVFKQTWTRLR